MQYVEFLIQAEAGLRELTCSRYTLTGGEAFINVSPAVKTSKHMAGLADLQFLICFPGCMSSVWTGHKIKAPAVLLLLQLPLAWDPILYIVWHSKFWDLIEKLIFLFIYS